MVDRGNTILHINLHGSFQYKCNARGIKTEQTYCHAEHYVRCPATWLRELELLGKTVLHRLKLGKRFIDVVPESLYSCIPSRWTSIHNLFIFKIIVSKG